jgi:hypothetical protein
MLLSSVTLTELRINIGLSETALLSKNSKIMWISSEKYRLNTIHTVRLLSMNKLYSMTRKYTLLESKC